MYSTDGEFSRLCSWRTITDGLSICPFYLKVFITILLSARGRQDMAENLATKMEDSIFKETFSYLRVRPFLTVASPIKIFLDFTNLATLPSIEIYVFNKTYRSDYTCVQRRFCIFDIFVCSDNDILFHMCLHARGR